MLISNIIVIIFFKILMQNFSFIAVFWPPLGPFLSFLLGRGLNQLLVHVYEKALYVEALIFTGYMIMHGTDDWRCADLWAVKYM